jgi:hypothetical protein
MNVKQAIEELQRFPPHLEVTALTVSFLDKRVDPDAGLLSEEEAMARLKETQQSFRRIPI